MSMSCFTQWNRGEEEAWQRVTAHQRWPSALESTDVTTDRPLTDKSASWESVSGPDSHRAAVKGTLWLEWVKPKHRAEHIIQKCFGCCQEEARHPYFFISSLHLVHESINCCFHYTGFQWTVTFPACSGRLESFAKVLVPEETLNMLAYLWGRYKGNAEKMFFCPLTTGPACAASSLCSGTLSPPAGGPERGRCQRGWERWRLVNTDPNRDHN